MITGIAGCTKLTRHILIFKMAIIINFKNNYAKYIVAAVCLYFILSQVVWTFRDNTPTRWDDSWNLLESNYYYKGLVGKELRSPFELDSIFPSFSLSRTAHPPFFKISSLPLYIIFGFSPDIGITTNFFYYILLIWCVYTLIKELSGKNAALLGIFLISTTPLMVGLSRIYLLDFAFIAMLMAGFTFYYKSNNFEKKLYVILFAVTFGLGTLTREYYPILLIPPIILMSILRIKQWNPVRTTNLYLAILIIGLIILTWFPVHASEIVYNIKYRNSGTIAVLKGQPQWNSIEGITYYPYNTIGNYSFTYLVLFITGSLILIYWFIKKISIDEKTNLLIGLFFYILYIYAVFTYFPGKDIRLVAPAFPAMSIITAVGLWKISLKQLTRLIILGFIILLGTVQINLCILGYNSFIQNVNYKQIPILSGCNQYLLPAKGDNWKIIEVMQVIKKDVENTRPMVAIYSNTQQFNPINFQMYSYDLNIPIRYIGAGSDQYGIYDYIVLKTGDVGIDLKNIIKPTMKRIVNDDNYFEFYSSILPDGASAMIYKRKTS